jgi:hypothetical protein
MEEIKTKLFMPNCKTKSVTEKHHIKHHHNLPKLISKIDLSQISNISAMDISF